jgi:hypothetical protein
MEGRKMRFGRTDDETIELERAATITQPTTPADRFKRPTTTLERFKNLERYLAGALHELRAIGWNDDATQSVEQLHRAIRRGLAAKARERKQNDDRVQS